MLFLSRSVLFLTCWSAAGSLAAEENGTLLVRHLPNLKGTAEGSVHVMMGENVSIEGTAKLLGDLLVPGTPAIVLKSGINYGGNVDGNGGISPSGYTITINTGATLGRVVKRSNPIALPAMTAPMSPTGTRTVTIKKSTDSAGSFATLKNLTLEKGVGGFSVPSGAYGTFTAKTNTAFVLGIAGAQNPSVYDFQSLDLESGSAVTLLGPVIINVASGMSVNGTIGESAAPAWLTLNVYSGNLTLNTGGYLYGTLNATNGGSVVTIKSSAQLIGGLACDKLSIESGGLIRPLAIQPNHSPSVSLTIPADSAVFPAGANISLQASAMDDDGTVTRVAFFSGSLLLSESTLAPYLYSWQNVPAGNYVLTAKATDNSGASTISAAVNVSVVAPPAITSATSATAQIGATFSYQIAATNNPTSFSATGLPNGLSFSATTGLISGTPSTASASSVSLGATNAGGTGTATLALTVTTAGDITSPSSAEGAVGTAFSFQVTATNGPTAFSATGLPLGLGIDTNSGLISGTPTRPGISRVVVTVAGTGGSISSTITLTILATLPYTTDFETSDGYVDGSLDSQLGWVISQGAVSVDSSDPARGIRSASISPSTPPAVATQTFATNSVASVVFVDFFAKPVARVSAATSTVFAAGPARFALQLSGTQGVLYSYIDDETGVAVWKPTLFSVGLDANSRASAWTRFTVRGDFSRRFWDLYADGRMVAFGLPFAGDQPVNAFSNFRVQGDTGAESRLDDVYVGEAHPLFADQNGNGIDDAWETAHGLALSSYNRSDSPAGNGVTVVQAYVANIDPNDFYAGKPPSLTMIGGNNQVSPPRTFNPLPLTIEVRDSSGATVLANAPVIFSVIAGAGQLNAAGAGDGATASTMAVRTDSNGRAGVYYQQPPSPLTQTVVKVTAGLSELTFATTSSGNNESFLLVAGGDSVLWQDANGLPRLWGANAEGQLGDGTLASRSQMKRLSGVTGALHGASLGAGHGVACDSSGQLVTWGDNYFGQLGDGSRTSRKNAAPLVGISDITSVAAGDHHSLALAGDGAVYSWGDNRSGQLGDGSQHAHFTPLAILGLANVIAISASGNFSAAVTGDGSVWVWGANDFGQLGTPSPSLSSVPLQIGSFGGAKKVVAGRNYLLVLTASGTVASWGAAYAGQLGHSNGTGSFGPTTVTGLANIVEIAAGDRHSVALDASGTVWVWGANELGQLADSSGASKATPIPLNLPSIKAIAAGSDHVVAMRTDGTLIAWGANDQSQLGSTLMDSFSATPAVVLPPND